MDLSWFNFSWPVILMVALSAVGIFIALIIYTRIGGVRSFSKLSNFDFAITVAFGSIIANSLTTNDPIFFQAVVALGALFILQIAVAHLRRKTKWMRNLVDNDPLLLMKGKNFLHHNLRKGKVTEKDVRSKLRQSGITQYSQIKAVVMETTGDLAVLQNSDPDHEVDAKLLEDVRGWEK